MLHPAFNAVLYFSGLLPMCQLLQHTTSTTAVASAYGERLNVSVNDDIFFCDDVAPIP